MFGVPVHHLYILLLALQIDCQSRLHLSHGKTILGMQLSECPLTGLLWATPHVPLMEFHF